MPLTLPVRMEATILDELGCQAETSVYAMVDPTASFGDILAVQDIWLADLNACTDGQIIATELEVLHTVPTGLRGSPASGSRVEQTGILAFTATGDTHTWSTSIPALSNGSTVTSGGKIVVTEDAPAEVLIDLLTEGGSVILAWTNATQQALASFARALISFRDYSSQLGRKSYERA